ncbi:helix-turn-helix transcriptional regulator [Clostridium sp. KNHs205]|uniref:helix-turn-helix domain-containing protein n=1 Tax=Clostridium sp. KNHs205 TaxID=1449050 RepID=UPI00051C77F0|nr:helix-turn-helix transcriptional regulator [Clostridium sp. KNHs205]
MAVNFIIIGRRVREIRLQKQISQEILAEWIEMSVTYISHIETAKKRASLETLVKIANALGTTVDQLLSGNQENDQEEYKEELVQLLEDCTSYEKRVIYEIAAAAKMSIRDNGWLRCKDD